MNNDMGGIRSDIEDGDVDDFDDDFDDEFDDDDDIDDDDIDDDEVAEGTDNVGDASVEINVEELIADFERSGDASSARRKEIRRRLEELAEEKSLEDTYAIDFDDN